MSSSYFSVQDGAIKYSFVLYRTKEQLERMWQEIDRYHGKESGHIVLGLDETFQGYLPALINRYSLSCELIICRLPRCATFVKRYKQCDFRPQELGWQNITIQDDVRKLPGQTLWDYQEHAQWFYFWPRRHMNVSKIEAVR